MGKGEISVHQVTEALKRQPALAAAQPGQAPKIVLDALVEQEVAAQAAIEAGLDNEPAFVQALQLMRRELLARSLQDGMASHVAMPTAEEIDRFYTAQPSLFAERRLYLVQMFTVEAPAGTLDNLGQIAKLSRNADDIARALQQAGLPFRSRLVPKAPEDMDFAVADAMAAMNEGQTLVLPQANGAVLYTVVHAEPAPLDRAGATPAVTAYLLGQRRRDALVPLMKTLRDSAHVEYKGTFAEAASAPSAAAVSMNP